MDQNYFIYSYTRIAEPSIVLEEAWVGDEIGRLIRGLILLLRDAGCKDEEKIDVRKIGDVEVFHVKCKDGKSWIFSPESLTLEGLELKKRYE